MSRWLMAYGRNMLLLCVIFMLSSLATNLVSYPVWSTYIRSLGASMTELGFVFSISNAVSAGLQIPSGMLSDRYGRKKLHALGTLIGVFPPLLYTFAMGWVDLIPWVVPSNPMVNSSRCFNRGDTSLGVQLDQRGVSVGLNLGSVVRWSNSRHLRHKSSLSRLLRALEYELSTYIADSGNREKGCLKNGSQK